MDFKIREMRKEEYPLLNEFLYNAIFIPDGVELPDKSIIEKPELSVYTKDFGEYADDKALVAEADGKVVGAVWTRIMDDYGHVDDTTPSLAISLFKEYRNMGIGTVMMNEIKVFLTKCGYKHISLSVQKANYALRMYLKTGFYAVGENEEEYIMLCDL